jgi:hypothetical protein
VTAPLARVEGAAWRGTSRVAGRQLVGDEGRAVPRWPRRRSSQVAPRDPRPSRPSSGVLRGRGTSRGDMPRRTVPQSRATATEFNRVHRPRPEIAVEWEEMTPCDSRQPVPS